MTPHPLLAPRDRIARWREDADFLTACATDMLNRAARRTRMADELEAWFVEYALERADRRDVSRLVGGPVVMVKGNGSE